MPAKTKEEIIYNAKRLEANGAPLEDIEKYVSMASSELPALSEPKKSLVGKISDTVKDISEKTIMAPFSSAKVLNKEVNPLKLAEQEGTLAKQRVQNVISNQLTNPRNAVIPEEVTAGAAALGSALVEAAPFTPLELGGAVGTEVATPAIGLATRTKMSEAIGNKILNTPLKVLKKDFERKASSQGANLIKNANLTGSRTEIFNKSMFEIEKLENSIQKQLSLTPTESVIDKFDVAAKLDDLMNEYKKSGISSSEVRKIMRVQDEFLASMPEKMSVQSANDVKRAIYRKIGDKGYLAQSPAVRVEAERSLASALRSEIENKVPGIKNLNSKQGEYIGIRDSLLSAIPSESKNVPSAITGDVLDAGSLRLARMLKGTPRFSGGITSVGKDIKKDDFSLKNK